MKTRPYLLSTDDVARLKKAGKDLYTKKNLTLLNETINNIHAIDNHKLEALNINRLDSLLTEITSVASLLTSYKNLLTANNENSLDHLSELLDALNKRIKFNATPKIKMLKAFIAKIDEHKHSIASSPRNKITQETESKIKLASSTNLGKIVASEDTNQEVTDQISDMIRSIESFEKSMQKFVMKVINAKLTYNAQLSLGFSDIKKSLKKLPIAKKQIADLQTIQDVNKLQSKLSQWKGKRVTFLEYVKTVFAFSACIDGPALLIVKNQEDISLLKTSDPIYLLIQNCQQLSTMDPSNEKNFHEDFDYIDRLKKILSLGDQLQPTIEAIEKRNKLAQERADTFKKFHGLAENIEKFVESVKTTIATNHEFKANELRSEGKELNNLLDKIKKYKAEDVALILEELQLAKIDIKDFDELKNMMDLIKKLEDIQKFTPWSQLGKIYEDFKKARKSLLLAFPNLKTNAKLLFIHTFQSQVFAPSKIKQAPGKLERKLFDTFLPKEDIAPILPFKPNLTFKK